jgi:ketosteroid isomerase-like protein
MDERAELLRRFYDSLNRAEPDYSTLHPEIRIIQAAEIVGTAGVFEGHDGARRSWEELLEAFDPTRFEPQKSEELEGGRLLVRCRWVGKGVASGVEIDAPVWHVWSFREGLLSRLEVYPTKRKALASLPGRVSRRTG